MVRDTKKHFGLLELPAIVAGLLTLVVALWELVWRRAVTIEDAWLFLQDTRFMLFGLVLVNLLFLSAQGIVRFVRTHHVIRWYCFAMAADVVALIVLADNMWGYGGACPTAHMNWGVGLSALAGCFSLLHARLFFEARPTDSMGRKRAVWPPALVFLSSLLALIFLGGLLLLSPGFSQVRLSVTDAFFLSASAVTVTGLSPVDMNAVLSVPGKVVLLVLMQVGAFGVMTFTYFAALLVGMGLSVRERVTFSSLLDQTGVSRVTSLVMVMVLLSFALEALGALNLYFAWQDVPCVPQDQRAWYAVFHAVSAFCNCGLSLFPNNLATPGIIGNSWGMGAMIVLMFCGSLGFAVYLEIMRKVRRLWGADQERFPVHWSTHAWLVARMTLVMLLAGVLLGVLGGFEARVGVNEHGVTFNFFEGIYNSVAARTSGFYVEDLSQHGIVYKMFLCSLMFVGGNPGSTSGGVMTSVIALVFMEVWRILRGRNDVEMHGRRIAKRNVERAMATLVLAVAWVFLLTLVMLLTENGGAGTVAVDAPKMFFEVVSSFATCGFSMDQTGQLSEAGKWLILFNMMIGRVGLFAFILIWMGQQQTAVVRYPETRLPLS